ncbi:MAG TPA: hypothetical protein VF915_23735, partial [Reyranella sp.]
AENNRQACLHNLGPLSSGARAFTAVTPPAKATASWDDRSRQACGYADRLYGVHFCCPEGGRYILSRNGKAMTCSVHGSAREPRQAKEPGERSPAGQLMRDLKELTAALTFTEHGLRAVLTIERK